MTDEKDRNTENEKKQDIDPTVVDATVIGSRPAGGLTGTLREGDPIGPYTVVRELGEGGFGSVYLCEQVKPVKRKVAVKIIKAGMDSKAVLARFEAERQALAVLNHPSIAKVFDAGVTENHRPYFVMEYVAGVPINEFCDDRKLDTRTRLELFAKVCDGMQHAHQKGIIHRDLKPGNILVHAEEGEDPQPKIIDFGIAKATGEDLTEETLVTQMGQMMGTPEYMSPEQAEGLVNEIDTRTDVYSLGVVLYQLICGRLPFEPDELRSRGYSEIQRIICEEDPPRPFQRFTSVSKQADHDTLRIARARGTTVDALSASLKRELEWIPLKALRKDPEERYASAEALGLDVRRYLDGEALEAGPETTAYRLKKFLKRHKAPVIAATVVVMALVGGVIASTVFAIEANEQAIIARKQTLIAEQQARLAEQQRILTEEKAVELQTIVDFQANQLSSIDVEGVGDSLRNALILDLKVDPDIVSDADFTGMSLGILDKHIFNPTLRSIDADLDDQPLVQAQLLQMLAANYMELGLIEEANGPLTRAMMLRTSELGREDPATLDSATRMGILCLYQGKYDQAKPYFMETLEARRRILGEEHPDTLESIHFMGFVLRKQGDFEGARSRFQTALDGRRRILGSDHFDTLDTINMMGVLLWENGRVDEAEPYFFEALDTRRRTLGDEHPSTLESINNMGALLRKQGRYREALPYFSDALSARRRALGAEHPMTVLSMKNMGNILQSLGRYEEATPYFEDALETHQKTLGENHPMTLSTMNAMAGQSVNLGRLEDARGYYMKAVLGRRRALGDEHRNTLASILALGNLLIDMEEFDEAEIHLTEVMNASRRTYGMGNSMTLMAVESLANLHQKRHEIDPDGGHDARAGEYRRLLRRSNE